MKTSGFTLLETIIYCALFSVLMTSAIVTVYALMSSSASTKQATNVISEALFINQKLVWTFTGATNVALLDTHTIQITRPDLGADSPLKVEARDNSFFITRGAAAPQSLTGLPFLITDVTMTYVTPVVTITYRVNQKPFRFQTRLQ